MVARRRRARQNELCDRDQNEEQSTKTVEKSVESDESGPAGQATEADAVNVSIMVMGSDEEGYISGESDSNSIGLDESAPDDAGYTADAEDGDCKGDDGDDADDEAEDNLEEDSVNTEEIEADEDDSKEVPPSPVDTSDSATENDATAVEHDFESEGNEHVEPSENVDTEPGDDGHEQVSNEDEAREETDVADGENSEVENQAGTEGSAGYAAAQSGHTAFDEGEMVNGNSDTRDGEFMSDENSADEDVAEPAEAGSEDGMEIANGHVANGHVDYVDVPSPLEAGDNDEMTDATEERRSEGEAPPGRHSEPVEPAEADDDHSDVENGVNTDNADSNCTDEYTDEHSEIEDRRGDASRAAKKLLGAHGSDLEEESDEVAEDVKDDADEHSEIKDGRENMLWDVFGSDQDSYDVAEDVKDVQTSGGDEYDSDMNEVAEQEKEKESKGADIASHSGESEGEEDGQNVQVVTHAATEDSANHEGDDGQQVVTEDESGTGESDDDINTRSYKLVPEKPEASSSLPEAKDTGNGTTSDKPTKRKRKEVETQSSKGGVIYIPRIPPGLDVTALRSLLSRVTQVKRIWLRPETNEQRRRRQSLGGSRRKQRFRDGWVELSSRKEAKRVVGLLNGQPMVSGKRRGRWADDLWCLKYLKGFAWTDLTNEVFGGRERVLRVRERVMEGRRVKEWVEGRGKGQGIKVRRFRQKRGIEDLDDVRAKQAAENVDREIDGGNTGAPVDDELVGMLFKKRRT